MVFKFAKYGFQDRNPIIPQNYYSTREKKKTNVESMCFENTKYGLKITNYTF